VTEEMTVQAVIEQLRAESAEHESVYYVYVVESGCRLSGVISLRDLLMAAPDTRVSDIAERELFTAHVDDDQEDVADQMAKYDLLALPVLDENGCLLGIVTVDDALDVLEEESAEDLELATGRRQGFAVAGLWQWVSRDGWLVVWGVAFLAAAGFSRWALGGGMGEASGELAFLPLVAVVLSPVVLRIAEDVASHAISRVIEEEEDEERTSLLRRFAMDGLSGLGLAIVVGLLAFAVVDVGLGSEADGIAVVAGSVAGALAVSVLLVTLAGTVIGWLAESRARAGKRVSQLGVAVTLMGVGVVSTVVLVIGAAMISISFLGG
jgi:magnesium transporter